VDVARTQYAAAQAAHETSQVELSQFPARMRVAESQLQSDRSAVRVAESDLRRREAELSLARKKLADLNLRAPISGSVARRHQNAGQHVPEDTAVFTLVQSDPLKFTGTVPEHAALAIHPGQVVRVRVQPLPGRQFEGRVVRVSPSVDVTSRTVQMEAEVPNHEGLLKPGLFARASVVLRNDQGVPFVPEAAVSYFAGITRVFVVGDGTVRERTVTLGTHEDGLIEVVKGIGQGERVATSGLAQLQDGAAISVAPAGGRPRK
jgi:membrane fusion protein (multidrug efflux system)